MVSSMDDTRLPYENNICLVQSIKNGGMFIATIETLTLNNPICEDFFFLLLFLKKLGRKMER